MLAIKLKRVGKKHQGSFRIVVAEKRSAMKGSFTDDLGWWNPRTDKYDVEKERALEWIKKGAQPTPTVHNLLVTAGALKDKKIPVHKVPKKAAEEAAASPAEGPKAPAPVAEKPAEPAPASAEAAADKPEAPADAQAN
ncbi:30S ribosomal protein S16 [Patescibacteria group bacterium]|nr:30S ribosomal protein S16 [Patescibacteria group bacterium]